MPSHGADGWRCLSLSWRAPMSEALHPRHPRDRQALLRSSPRAGSRAALDDVASWLILNPFAPSRRLERQRARQGWPAAAKARGTKLGVPKGTKVKGSQVGRVRGAAANAAKADAFAKPDAADLQRTCRPVGLCRGELRACPPAAGPRKRRARAWGAGQNGRS
jgi:hypothetical protein